MNNKLNKKSQYEDIYPSETEIYNYNPYRERKKTVIDDLQYIEDLLLGMEKIFHRVLISIEYLPSTKKCIIYIRKTIIDYLESLKSNVQFKANYNENNVYNENNIYNEKYFNDTKIIQSNYNLPIVLQELIGHIRNILKNTMPKNYLVWSSKFENLIKESYSIDMEFDKQKNIDEIDETLPIYNNYNEINSFNIKNYKKSTFNIKSFKMANFPLDKPVSNMNDSEFEKWLFENMENEEWFCGKYVFQWKKSNDKVPKYCLDLIRNLIKDNIKKESVLNNKIFKYSQTSDGGKVYEVNLEIDLPKTLYDILSSLKKNNSYGLLVGGAVRDRFLGLSPKDLDVEVYNINYENLLNFLKPFDRKKSPDIVGKSFGIIKIVDNEGNDYDFSIPRKESKKGTGHKGFEVEFDPNITPKEAASRRDFSFNSLAYDPLDHKVYDYFNGVEDIQNKVIRATSPAFAEDPLRVLRGMQFAGRFGFSLEEETAKMMRGLVGEYGTLAKERITEEWMKLFTKGKHPGKALELLVQSGWIKLFPELDAFIPDEYEEDLIESIESRDYPGLSGYKSIKQEPEWHPEGAFVRKIIKQ